MLEDIRRDDEVEGTEGVRVRMADIQLRLLVKERVRVVQFLRQAPGVLRPVAHPDAPQAFPQGKVADGNAPAEELDRQDMDDRAHPDR